MEGAGDDSDRLCGESGAQWHFDCGRIPVLFFHPAPSVAAGTGVFVAPGRKNSVHSVVVMGVQLSVLSGDSVFELGGDRFAAIHHAGFQLPDAAVHANAVFLDVSRLHARALAQHQYRPLGFGKIPAVRAEIRPVQQLLSQHARVGGNAHGDARTVAFGHGGICVSCADCAVVPVYQAALSDRPARRSGAGLGRLQSVRLVDCVITV